MRDMITFEELFFMVSYENPNASFESLRAIVKDLMVEEGIKEHMLSFTPMLYGHKGYEHAY